ncbi:hypothetical protein D3Z36_02960 [Lachnospiraceae bacterium]|nr:hypothetical protein [Lachnospiraceae bacterium]
MASGTLQGRPPWPRQIPRQPSGFTKPNYKYRKPHRIFENRLKQEFAADKVNQKWYCESVRVTESMSKAGCPYDNAPMERYFNTLKNECTNLYEFQTEEALYRRVEEFAYANYNHVRPHSFNAYRTPYQARIAS